MSAGWDVPTTAVSGVYVALLTRRTGGQSQITFVVRTTAPPPTWSSRRPTRPGRPTTPTAAPASTRAAQRAGLQAQLQPSVQHPRASEGRDFYFSAEYAMVRFLERNGYDVTYIAGADTDRRGAAAEPQDLPVGRARRVLVRPAAGRRRAGPGRRGEPRLLRRQRGLLAHALGAHLAGTSTDDRTLVSYKETWGSAKIDPSSEWTGTWRDPRYASTAAGGRPRTGSSAPCTRPTTRTCPHGLRPRRASCGSGAARRWPPLPPGDLRARAAHRRVRVERGPRQRLPARGSDPDVEPR